MSVLVGLHGEAGSGKDTVAKLIIDWCNDTYPTCLSRRYSFAKPVYELASIILGVTPEFLGERRGKEIDQWFTVTQSQLERARDVWFKYGIDKFEDFSYVWPIFEEKYLNPQQLISENKEDGLYSLFISPRKMLQLVGTELGRQLVHERIWLIILEQSIAKDDPDVAVITDVRFPNEGELLRETNHLDMDSLIVNVVPAEQKFTIKSDHPSESGIPAKYITHELVNKFDGINNLKLEVYNFCDLELEPLVG
ncbi:dNMP kinase [Salmonella phage phC17]|uniref:DNMP kinase n=2 Tax=Tequintavirus TaxID=187218 RepID=A0AAF0JZI9_9CAUD|nr:dNMP kinase [Salmonella phage phB7]WGG14698.1 dNMP kinase [Salmonella phage phC17]